MNHRSSAFAERIGCELESAEGGIATARLVFQSEHVNTYGTVHGGAMAALADYAMGRAVSSLLTDGESLDTVELQLNYLRPADGGLTVRARVLHRGRSLAVCEADVLDTKGKAVARVSGTFAIRCPQARAEAVV